MGAINYSETSVDSQRTKRRYIPEDGTLQIHFYFHAAKSVSDDYGNQVLRGWVLPILQAVRKVWNQWEF
jgi:hypothetical protein